MTIRRAAIAATLLLSGLVPLAAMTPASAALNPPSLCAPPSDTIAPAVSTVTFKRASIKLNSGSRLQTVTATAADVSGGGSPSGVTRLFAEIRGNHFYAGVKLKLASGTPASGEWTGQFTVSKYAHPGTYSIEFLSIIDAARNDQEYANDGTVAQSPNSLSLLPADDPTFTVTGTPAKRPTPKPAGGLKTFSLVPATVNTTAAPRRVHVSAQFTGASPSRVTVQLANVPKSTHRFVYLHITLHRHAGGQWTGTVRVPRWLGKQTLQATLYLGYGSGYRPSERLIDAQRLSRRHLPSELVVVSGVDSTKPTVTGLAFSPSSIDSTTGHELVTVTARAHDTGSGVKYIDVTGGIRHGVNGAASGDYPFAAAGIGYLSSDSFNVRLKKTPSGRWVGSTTVRQCVPSGTYKLTAVAADNAGNYHYYGTKELAKAGLRSTIKVVSKHGDIEAPYVYSAATYGAQFQLFLNFSEGVRNVDASTLAVYPLSPAQSRFTTPASIESITCANGTATVDCSGSGGLVTSAILTIPSLMPTKTYEVYANLNQVDPQLTDGNRNPLSWQYPATEVKDS